jgi:D-alanyl-D-alanine carboxypeptidase/D-alanyl-D-alanine-endopeptidase (penicillin-binding protein 4)
VQRSVSALLRGPVLILAAAVSAGAFAQGSLPAPVARALEDAHVPVSSVSIVVQGVRADRPEVSVNAAVPMQPASVMKLVTTFAALERLGLAYRWKTEAYIDGELRHGVLRGDLVLKGYGDPDLTLEQFWLMLRNLRARGLREIRGDLILDRSYFGPQEDATTPFDDEPLRPYNVLPDALLLNFKSVRFDFVAEPERGAVRVLADPHPADLQVVSRLRLAGGACGDWKRRLDADFGDGGDSGGPVRALFTGRFAASCGDKTWHVALFTHSRYVAGVFRELWRELGGAWTGGLREAPVPPGAKLFYTHESTPLDDVVRDMNKFSNNVMARQIYLTLGAESSGPPATPASSFAAVRAALAQAGLQFPELVMDNGSGLSRAARISAHSLADLLLTAYRGPDMPELAASLPVVGVDGTMKRHMRGDPAAGHAHIKTGTLDDVRAIAGYVLDRGGDRHVVVMLVNGPQAPEAEPAIETLIDWVRESGTR